MVGGTGGFVTCFPVECVAQFVQVSSDMNSECFQLENNFIICYHRAVISTRPTLITRHRGRESSGFCCENIHQAPRSSVLKAAAGAIVLEMKLNPVIAPCFNCRNVGVST